MNSEYTQVGDELFSKLLFYEHTNI